MRRTSVRAARIVTAILAVSACAAQAQGPSSHFGRAGQGGDATLQQSFESSGILTKEEYTRATDRIVECALSHSVVVWKEDRYGQYIFASHDPDAGGVLDACEAGEDGDVRSEYERNYTDPDGEGVEVYYRCFVRAGVLSEQGKRKGTLAEALNDLSAQAGAEEWALIDRCLYDPMGNADGAAGS